jgi:predicted enzyme related to lactoylglutathione lyase
MGKRTKYEPGTFSYVELSTSDSDGAKEFYAGLLGWEYEDVPLPEEAGGGFYTQCKVQGDTAAAIFAGSGDVPPHWNNYVTVESADDAQAKAEELGAKVQMGVMDVMGLGRMAMLADPTGASFAIWQPLEGGGAERVNDPGSFTWNELHTPDDDAALEFNTGFFGWSTQEMETGGGPRYVVVQVGERSNGGIMGTQEGEPPNWMPYFTVESRDDAVALIGSSGGTVHAQMEFGPGEIAVATDPQGAAFGIFAGDVDD